jgi:hypothetical protein
MIILTKLYLHISETVTKPTNKITTPSVPIENLSQVKVLKLWPIIFIKIIIFNLKKPYIVVYVLIINIIVSFYLVNILNILLLIVKVSKHWFKTSLRDLWLSPTTSFIFILYILSFTFYSKISLSISSSSPAASSISRHLYINTNIGDIIYF